MATPTVKKPHAVRRGLECPDCGCMHFRVLYTRRAWGGRLLRRRTCRHCGRRMTTYEVLASDAPALSI
jgi:transcriptional regulator NrdR family protein